MTEATREIVVDLFAGAGGASCGIRAATGRDPDIAVNHNPLAIEIHRLNHPDTEHLTCDVFEVDPLAATRGRPVGLLWASPDCTHFSRAKGGRPVEKRLRSLAWVVVRWASKVRPRLILLENVPEFRTWGPLGPDNRPLAAKKGQTFRRWSDQLRGLGYEVEFRELVAADYGTPTIRKRFILVARCDGEPVRWPVRTHAPRGRLDERRVGDRVAFRIGHSERFVGTVRKVNRDGSLAVQRDGLMDGLWTKVAAGELEPLLPWRSAAECIDWALPCPSIFERRRPLAEATMRRIARGIQKFVIDAAEPFVVTCNHGGDGFRGQGLGEPMNTITASRDAQRLVMPCVAGVGGRAGQSAETDPQEPLGTVTGKNDRALVAPILSKYHGAKGGEARAFLIRYFSHGGQDADCRDPMHTLTARHRMGLVTVAGQEYQIIDIGLRMLEPRELLRAQFGRYADEYMLFGTKAQQVEAIGNSVPPEMVEALVRANP